MFYLKYRPKNVRDIDNTQVKEMIGKILESGHLSHAFLFVGQKGTGKTSTARIFAKAINCLNNKFSGENHGDFEPCNSCANCVSIDSFSSVDIVEMDAASNRGIDDIKNLIRESNFVPMTTKYRVFIIDEAHMITTEAFNALLKTLEEPSPSVIFILATTNKEKLPKTIISRCNQINFGRAKKNDIIHMLKRIAEGEKIKIDEKIFSLVANVSEHSFRDGAKVFEELVIQDKLKLEDAEKFLGIAQYSLTDLIESKDVKTVLAWIDDFSQNGGSIKTLIEQTLESLRIILLNKNGVVNADEQLDSKLTKSEVVRLIKHLTEAYQNLRVSPIESLSLEIAVVEFYNGRITNKN
ncbi:DNA polymerase III subunit gamma/tau [Candidatus Roizmanbacteria bacterium]|jgi:DNA polymerase-3 subunit gamma/tau|nr:DNA polymerase III subunit gamma/tau [Candidatus Roizmanbacteria bacterium]